VVVVEHPAYGSALQLREVRVCARPTGTGRVGVEDVPSTMKSCVRCEPPVCRLLVAVDLSAGRVVLTGELDRGTCVRLDAACRVLAADGPPIWVVDLGAVAFCDAGGLRALAAACRVAEETGAAVVIAGARPYLRRLLHLVGLGDVLAPVARSMPRPASEPAAGPATVQPKLAARLPRGPGDMAPGDRAEALSGGPRDAARGA
jgi:anti-anti-sigma factor